MCYSYHQDIVVTAHLQCVSFCPDSDNIHVYMWHLSNICVFAIVKDTGTELMPTDIKYYQLFGGEKVIFEKEEVTDMKKFGKAGTYLR